MNAPKRPEDRLSWRLAESMPNEVLASRLNDLSLTLRQPQRAFIQEAARRIRRLDQILEEVQ